MDKLYVIKTGGAVIDDEAMLQNFLEDFSSLGENKILVHGGGKLATRLAEDLGVPQQMIEGRRITDADTLRILTMVYGGLINKQIVARLQAARCNAIGLTGADADVIRAHRRVHPSIDYGWVGDIDAVNQEFLARLIDQEITPVFAPLTHNGEGHLLNTNADTIAREIAVSLSNRYEVSLVFIFERPGVMTDTEDAASVVPRLDKSLYEKLKQEGKIFSGMIPKLDNAFQALEGGVKRVIIGEAGQLRGLIAGSAGTTIQNG